MATAKSLVSAKLEEVGRIRQKRGFNHEEFDVLHYELKYYVDHYPFCDKKEMKELLNKKFNLFNYWNVKKEIMKLDDVFVILKKEIGHDVLVNSINKVHENIRQYRLVNDMYRKNMCRLKRGLADTNAAELRRAYYQFHKLQEHLVNFDELEGSLVTDGHRIVINSEKIVTAGVGLVSLIGKNDIE